MGEHCGEVPKVWVGRRPRGHPAAACLLPPAPSAAASPQSHASEMSERTQTKAMDLAIGDPGEPDSKVCLKGKVGMTDRKRFLFVCSFLIEERFGGLQKTTNGKRETEYRESRVWTLQVMEEMKSSLLY